MKEHFAEISKNLARYRLENNFIRHQNNYVELIARMSRLFVTLLEISK